MVTAQTTRISLTPSDSTFRFSNDVIFTNNNFSTTLKDNFDLNGLTTGPLLQWNTSDLDIYANETSDFTRNNSELIRTFFTDLNEYKIAQFINSYYLYLVSVVGIPGNVACIVTLTFLKLNFSSAVYMLALAVADLLAIALKLAYFLLTKNDIRLGSRNCQVIFMFGTVSQTYANWILVAMTVERFIAIWFPFQVKKLCTKRKALGTLAVILILFIAVNCQFLVTYEEVKDPFMSWDCRPKPEYAKFIKLAWSWIDGTLYAILPLFFITVFNSLIIHAVRRSTKAKTRLTNKVSNSSETTSNQRQVTMMLLTTSVVFVVLVLPNCIFFIAREYWTWKETNLGIARYYLVYQIVFVLSDLNHAVNFYLYFLSGRKFRRKFIQLLTCGYKRYNLVVRENLARSISNVATIMSQTASPARYVKRSFSDLNPVNPPFVKRLG